MAQTLTAEDLVAHLDKEAARVTREAGIVIKLLRLTPESYKLLETLSHVSGSAVDNYRGQLTFRGWPVVEGSARAFEGYIAIR